MPESKSVEWGTPQKLFDELNKEFKLDCDLAASYENTKCDNWFDKSANSLKLEWKNNWNHWLNPPYGRGLGVWIKKCHELAVKRGLVVALLPARTDTKWFHEYIYNKYEIRFIKGRLRFEGAPASAPFPSMIVVFK